MPYFAWRGVRLDGQICKGKLFVTSAQELDDRLFKQRIALLSYKPIRQLYVLPISLQQKVLFFQQLEALLSAGMHVWQSLKVLSEQMHDVRFADCIARIAQAVDEGHPLHTAMAQQVCLFSYEMVHVVDIGAHAGNLPVALTALCDYLEQKQKFAKQLRAALTVPLLTLGFFFLMLIVIVLTIVPRYAQLFGSMDKQMPALTRGLLLFHRSLSSYYAVGWLLIVATVLGLFVHMRHYASVRKQIDYWWLRLPVIGAVVQEIIQVQFFRSLALLLSGGMPLVPALHIAREAVGNQHARKQLDGVMKQVQAGHTFADALQLDPLMGKQDIVSLVTIGQESGKLPDMIGRIADIYQQRVQQKLRRYTIVLQPVCMLLLGLAVAALIFAVYMPLFNLADLI